MPGVAASGIAAKNLRGRGWTFYDYGTAGGLTTFANPALTPATGQTITQQANGYRLQWTSATVGQQVGVRYTPASALNFDQVDTFAFEFDFGNDPTLASLGGVRVIMAGDTGSTYTNYFDKLANTGTAHYGRRIFRLNKSDFAANSSPSWSSIKRVEIFWQRSTRATTVVPLDIVLRGFYTNARHQTPTLIWTFDDSDATQYTEAYLGNTNPTSCMSAYGWKGTCFINSNVIGTGGYMTTAQLTTLYDAGWDICPHGHAHNAVAWQYAGTYSGTTLTLANSSGVDFDRSAGEVVTISKVDPIEAVGRQSLATANQSAVAVNSIALEASASGGFIGYTSLDFKDQDAVSSNLATCISFLRTNGFRRALNFYSYPYGYFSETAIALLQRQGINVARTLGTMSGSTETFNWSGLGYEPSSLDWMRLPARGLGSGDTAAGVLADIDLTIKRGGAIIIYGHNFVAAPAVSREFSIANLKSLFDGVKMRERLGLLQVKTLKEYYDGCIADA